LWVTDEVALQTRLRCKRHQLTELASVLEEDVAAPFEILVQDNSWMRAGRSKIRWDKINVYAVTAFRSSVTDRSTAERADKSETAQLVRA
jgi:hypothetical protein